MMNTFLLDRANPVAFHYCHLHLILQLLITSYLHTLVGFHFRIARENAVGYFLNDRTDIGWFLSSKWTALDFLDGRCLKRTRALAGFRS